MPQPLAVKRRLPVVTNDEQPSQSPWLWVLYGGVLIVSFWVPLMMLALFLGGKITRALNHGQPLAHTEPPALGSFAPTAALVLLSFALACFAGGVIVTRFSPRVRRADPAMAALVAVAFILFFAALGHALPASALFAVLLALLAAGPSFAMLGRAVSLRRSRGHMIR